MGTVGSRQTWGCQTVSPDQAVGLDMPSSLTPSHVGLENNHDADDPCAFREASPQGGAGSMGNLVMLVGVTLDWGGGRSELGIDHGRLGQLEEL